MLVTQLRPTLCNPVDCSSPGASVHGVLQARMLEWVAIPFSTANSRSYKISFFTFGLYEGGREGE